MATWERDRSVPEVLQDIFGNIQELIRSEVRLAKAEVREEAGKAGKAIGTLGAGAVAGMYTIALLLVAGVLALAMILPAWLAALLVACVTGITAAALISEGRAQLKKVNAPPQRTIDNVKENLEWAKNQSR
jgi:uncharacterized membrane protein